MKMNIKKILNGNSNKQKSELFIIIGLVLLSFAIRLCFINIPQNIGDDAANYAVLGKNLIEGRGFVGISGQIDSFSSPLYPFFIGIFYLFIKNLELAGRLVSVLFGTLLIVPVYFLSKRIYNKKVAIISSILVVFYFVLIQYSIEVLSESMYTFLLAVGVLIGYIALVEQKNILYLLAGFIFGLCYLTRAEGIGYVLVLILMMGIFWLLNQKREAKRKLFICSILLILGLFIVSAPYLVFFHDQTGEWIVGQKGGTNLGVGEVWLSKDPLAFEKLVYGLTEDGMRMKGHPFLVGEMEKVNRFDYIIHHPKEIAKAYVISAGNEYYRAIPSIFPPLLILLIGVGLFRGGWTRERFKKEVYMASIVVYPLLLYPLFHIESRYLMPVLPIAIIWSANGINELQDWLHQTTADLKIDWLKQRLIFKNLVLVIVLLSLISMTALIPFYFYQYQPTEHKEAGLWMKENVPQNPVIMAKRPCIAFYAEGTFIPLPYANYTEMMKYAKYHHVKYIVMDEKETAKVRPQFAFLLDETKAPKDDLKLIYKDSNTHNKILIYELQ